MKAHRREPTHHARALLGKTSFHLRLITMAWLMALLGFAQPIEDETTWLAHLSANEQFQSDILFRNDAFDAAVTYRILFLDTEGNPAQVSLRDASGSEQVVTEQALTLAPQASTSLSLRAIGGGDGRSLQAKVIVPEASLLTVEADFTGTEGDLKVNKVGVPVVAPAKLFRINLDDTPDPVSNLVEVRGLAITNTAAENACECLVTLVDETGAQLATSLVSIPAEGKWLGASGNLFPGAGSLPGSGKGYLDASCSEEVVVLALAFEGSLMSTVPVTRYDLD